jgi:hypothetical protein
LDRYLRVAEHTPLAVQNAVDAGTLPITVAEQVASLSKRDKSALETELNNGGDVVETVRKYVPGKAAGHQKAHQAKTAFFKILKAGCDDLEGRVDLAGWIEDEDVEVIARAERLLKELKQQRKRQPKKRPTIDDFVGAL